MLTGVVYGTRHSDHRSIATPMEMRRSHGTVPTNSATAQRVADITLASAGAVNVDEPYVEAENV